MKNERVLIDGFEVISKVVVQHLVKSFNEELFYEMAERGKELEKIRKLVYGWKDQIPDELYSKLESIIKKYETRCTK